MPEAIECTHKITGKLVRVRHATEGDISPIRQISAKYGIDVGELDLDNHVVAEQDGVALGFASMGKAGKDGSFIRVLIEEQSNYLAELMVKHLLEPTV